MKIFYKISLVVFVFVFMFGLAVPNNVFAATVPTLGTVSSFGVLAGAAVSDTPPASNVTGNVGLSPTGGTGITVLSCTDVTGTIYDTNAGYLGGHDLNHGCLVTNAGLLITAKADLSTAYNNVRLQVPVTAVTASTTDSFAAINGGTYILTPGIYNSGSTMGVPVALTLDGGGDPNAVFIFQAGSTLNTVAGSTITLTNGAKASNVFWQVGTSATLGTASNFKGTIMAAVSITDTGGSTVLGRLLADADNTDADSTGAVTLNHTTLTIPTTLTLAKIVTNDNGGTALNTAWTLSTIAPSPTTISGATGSVAVTNAAVVPGVYTLSESGGSAGYLPSTYSCVTNGGAPVSGNTITLAAGDETTCTITNNDIAPSLTLNKIVVGGAALPTAWTLTATGTGGSPTNLTGTHPVISGATFKTDTYTLAESGGPSNYTASAWSCVGATVTGSSVTLGLGDVAVCTITNTYVTPPSSSGGSYTPSVSPLIDVVKMPSPLALPAGPGAVTYTYTLRNIGTVPVNNITMIDDSCSPLNLISGDTNADSKLDMSETWIYRCSTTLSATRMNTVVATGYANGISATDIAYATVVVGASIVPPLIHVTKIPNPLALLTGSGMVTYTEKITNPGTVALSNVSLTDDKCSPMKYISGDTNGNLKLDTNETWTYTCKTRLAKTTTNTARASGQANGLTARDFAIATVVVTNVPGLPKTGFGPENNISWNIIVLAGIFALLIFFYFIRRKQTN